jgi:hypothetical protein
VNWFQQWLHDRHEPWRKPDKFEGYDNHYSAVWYSAPIGKYGTYDESFPPEQSQYAYLVELSREAFILTAYTHVSEWYIDEPWVPEEHGDFWRTQSVEMEPEQVRDFFHQAVQADPSMKMPRDPEATARLFMSLGNAYISYYGGDEDEAESLP